ncbi:response regulator transcription factor [Knoellia sp. S7-12]|uniref:response regulator transcription factor n=1 Tax=Knoellia sp. S7-12 TaxID=3126698 RepID=UPI0033689E65
MRIVIADDHDLYLSGMRAVLGVEPDIDIVADVASSWEAVTSCVDLDPDVVILGHRLPRNNGIEACRAIKARAPRTMVLILTESEDEADLIAAITAGASGYLLKEFPAQQIIDSMRLAHRGQTLIPVRLTTRLIDDLSRLGLEPPVESTATRLSDHERRILGLVAQGKANREIAAQLYISQNTVKNHVHTIRIKLNLGSRIELVRHVLEQGTGELSRRAH